MLKSLLARNNRGAEKKKDTGSAPKEPFAAIIADEMSREVAKSVAAEFGWEQADISAGTIDDAARTAGIGPASQVLLVDLGSSADPEADTAALVEMVGEDTAVICLGAVNDVMLYRRIVSAGAADYLVKPLEVDALRGALRRIEESRERHHSLGERGRVVFVVGTRGGVGSSTIAANLAWLLAEKSKEKIALIDLDFRFGTLALQFDVEAGSGLHDALRQPDRVDELFLERSMRQATANLALLSTEEPLGEPSTFSPAAIMLLLEQVSMRHDWVVIDLPRHAAGTQREVLTLASDILLVTDMSLAGLRDTLRLRELIRLSAPSAKLRVVGSLAATSRGHLTQQNYESGLKTKMDAVIPFDPATVSKSANAGKPLAQVARNAKISAAFSRLVSEIRKTPVVASPAAKGPGGI